MGGVGSGRFGERDQTTFVDDCDAVRIWDLRRQMAWRVGECVEGAVRMDSGRVLPVAVDLRKSGEVLVGPQRIQLSTSRGTYGGLRWWFHCPIEGTRVACLYRHPRTGLFIARETADLRYRSAYQGDHDVAIQQAKKALRRLAGPHYDGPPTRDLGAIPRPYRQRRSTYERNLARARRALERADSELLLSVERILGRPLGAALVSDSRGRIYHRDESLNSDKLNCRN